MTIFNGWRCPVGFGAMLLCLAMTPALMGADGQMIAGDINDHGTSLISIDASGHYVYTQESDQKKPVQPARTPLKPEATEMADDPYPCSDCCDFWDPQPPPPPSPPGLPPGNGCGYGGTCSLTAGVKHMVHRIVHIFG